MSTVSEADRCATWATPSMQAALKILQKGLLVPVRRQLAQATVVGVDVAWIATEAAKRAVGGLKSDLLTQLQALLAGGVAGSAGSGGPDKEFADDRQNSVAIAKSWEIAKCSAACVAPGGVSIG
eukprot:gene401-754_t